MRRSNPEFLNGVPELLVLKLLSCRAMYGYEIVEAIRRESDQVFEFGEGSIYPILHRLEAEKLLTSRTETVNQRQRVVYRTTAAGKRRLGEISRRWNTVAEAIRTMLDGDSNAEPAVL
ncbi:MAG: PadR family transcriptional regulator [Planctomycetaceae bacterium]